MTPLQQAYQQHDRRWEQNAYVYAVVSRRSHGLSIGINLNPDKACNFDCIYCQVDRSTPPVVREVDLPRLRDEIDSTLAAVQSGALFAAPPFDALPGDARRIRDFAFSGDGEPTTCPLFAEAVAIVAEARCRVGLLDSKIVLITDACYLTRPAVREGLSLMDANGGEIWAKLDAGTEDYYRLVNRPNYPLAHVLANILDAARARPLVIQSLFMRVHGERPPAAEIGAYCERLNELVAAGAGINLVQLYTIARRTTEAYATLLSDAELDELAATVRARVSLPVEVYYGV